MRGAGRSGCRPMGTRRRGEAVAPALLGPFRSRHLKEPASPLLPPPCPGPRCVGASSSAGVLPPVGVCACVAEGAERFLRLRKWGWACVAGGADDACAARGAMRAGAFVLGAPWRLRMRRSFLSPGAPAWLGRGGGAGLGYLRAGA